jgi:hypothetical protein
MSRPRTAPDIDRFPVAVSVADVRRVAGGKRRLRTVEKIALDIEGMSVELSLLRTKATLGGGSLTYLACPRCGKPSERLRFVRNSNGLIACGRCIAELFGARYPSQRRSSRNLRCKIGEPEMTDDRGSAV